MRTRKNVLLEAAAWEYINIRQTMASQKLSSEAGYRFSRGVHPSVAKTGLLRAIELMRELGGGEIAKGIVDKYPRKPKKIVIDLPVSEVKRQLGRGNSGKANREISWKRWNSKLKLTEDGRPTTESIPRSSVLGPPSCASPFPTTALMLTGAHDLVEEIARMYGYENIPISRMNDELPPQKANVDLEQEEASARHS